MSIRELLRRQRDVALQRRAPTVPDGSFFYGDGTTIHHTNYLHVETHGTRVVAVWFRCRLVPFKQVEVPTQRADEMTDASKSLPALTGLTFVEDGEI